MQTAERAIKTFCQAALAVIGVQAVAVDKVQWVAVASIATTATVISVLTSIASAGIADRNTPSVVPVDVVTPEPVVEKVEPASPLTTVEIVAAAEAHSDIPPAARREPNVGVPEDPADILPNIPYLDAREKEDELFGIVRGDS